MRKWFSTDRRQDDSAEFKKNTKHTQSLETGRFLEWGQILSSGLQHDVLFEYY